MGKYVDAIDELRNRLATAQGASEPLDSTTEFGLKNLFIGNRNMIEQCLDCPSVVIEPVGITDEYNQARSNQMQSMIRLNLIVKFPINVQYETNRLYNTTDDTGFLYFIETVLNVLSLTTGGSIDPRFGQDALKPVSTNVTNIREAQQFITAEIECEFQTSFYAIGGR